MEDVDRVDFFFSEAFECNPQQPTIVKTIIVRSSIPPALKDPGQVGLSNRSVPILNLKLGA